MNDNTKIKALERRLGFYERLVAHQQLYIKQSDLSEDFSLWLTQQVVIQGIGT